VPVTPRRLHVKDWTLLEEKNDKKLAIWKGRALSIAGRTTLIEASLSNSFIYHMSTYLLPKTTTARLDKQRRTFLWQGGSQKRKYHLVRWDIINKSKKQGGLGIKNIQKMNISLLYWWWKLEAEKGMWQDIIKRKYMQDTNVGSVRHKIDDSPVWCDLLKVKHIYLRGRTFLVKNRKKPLSGLIYGLLTNRYALSILSSLIFVKVKTFQSLILWSHMGRSGSRYGSPILFDQWITIINITYAHVFEENEDVPIWKWNKNSLFSTKLVYNFLTREDSGGAF
jgi:hypothetical protein